MNNLELMAVKELENVIRSAMDKVHEKHIGQIESARLHIQGDLKEALKIIAALEENSTPKPR